MIGNCRIVCYIKYRQTCLTKPTKERKMTTQATLELRAMEKIRHETGTFLLLDCIGKIEVTSKTDPYTIACLMKARPHTFKLDGKYI